MKEETVTSVEDRGVIATNSKQDIIKTAPDEGVMDGDVAMEELDITLTENLDSEVAIDGMTDEFTEDVSSDVSGGDMSNEIIYDDSLLLDENMFEDRPMIEDGMIMDPGFDMGMGAGTEVKDPLLSSWFFVLGISGAVLLVSIVLGALLARRKIKKGIDLYEG